MKERLLARSKNSPKTIEWANVLDNITGGNFAWHVTIARYHTDVENPYLTLWATYQEESKSEWTGNLSRPISVDAARQVSRKDSLAVTLKRSGASTSGHSKVASPNLFGREIVDDRNRPTLRTHATPISIPAPPTTPQKASMLRRNWRRSPWPISSYPSIASGL